MVCRSVVRARGRVWVSCVGREGAGSGSGAEGPAQGPGLWGGVGVPARGWGLRGWRPARGRGLGRVRGPARGPSLGLGRARAGA